MQKLSKRIRNIQLQFLQERLQLPYVKYSSDVTESPYKPRVAMISGHIGIELSVFIQHYEEPLDISIRRGDQFIVSNSAGVDTFALEYLRARGVDPRRVTIYLPA
jgi:hypothetical protein